MIPTILKSGLAVSAALLLSRLFGFVREATLAGTLGTSQTADVAIFLIGLPDFLVNVLGAGGFTAVLVILFRKDMAEAARLLFQASLAILAATGFLCIILILARNSLVDALAPGFDEATRAATIDLLPIAILSIPLVAASGASIAMLQAHERFFVAALGGVIVNVVLIIALVGRPAAEPLVWVAVAILVAALIRWLVLLGAMGRPAMSGWSMVPWLINGKIMADFLRTAAAEGIVFFYPFALRAMATLFGVGGLATVNYATKLVQLPLGVIIMTVTTVMLPRLASLAPTSHDGDMARFRETTARAQAWIIGLGGLSVSLFAMHSRWLVEVTFGWGSISSTDLDRIALYTAVFSLTLLPAGLNIFLRRTLNALDDTRTPLIAELIGFAGFLVMAIAVRVGDGQLQFVLLAAAGGNLCATVALLAGCHRRGASLVRDLLKPRLWMITLIAAAVTTVPGLLLRFSEQENTFSSVLAFLTAGILGLAVLCLSDPWIRAAVLSRVHR